MKKLAVVVAMLLVASGVFAGPLAQTAAPIEVGQIDGLAGVMIAMGDLNEDHHIIGVRGTYGVIENLLASLGFGYDLEAEENEIIMQIAGQYALAMLELPVDLAIRVDYEGAVEALGDGAIGAMAVISKQIEQVAGLALYGGVGLASGIGDNTMDTELAAAFGAQYDLPVENLSCFGEASLVKDADMLYLNLGVNYTF